MRIQRQSDTYAFRLPPPGMRRVAAPMDDERWTEHYNHVNHVLDNLYQKKQDSRSWYGTTDAEGKVTWNKDRKAKYARLIAAYLAGERAGGKDEWVDPIDTVPTNRQALILGGISGAGKGWTIKSNPRIRINRPDYWISNVDDLKELAADPRFGLIPTDEEFPELKGLSNMERTPLIHYEMDELLDSIVKDQMRQGRNIIHDGTMAGRNSTMKRVRAMKEAAYKLAGAFIRVRPEDSARGIADRQRSGHQKMLDEQGAIAAGLKEPDYLPVFHGGRPVPGYVSQTQVLPNGRTVNEENFDFLTQDPSIFDNGWIKLDNSFIPGDPDYLDKYTQERIPARVVASSNTGMYANAVPALTAMRIMAALRRRAEAMPNPFTDFFAKDVSGTIYYLLDSYEDGEIDYPTLVQGIVAAVLLEPEEDHRTPEQKFLDEWDGFPDYNDPVWIRHAETRGVLTSAQVQEIFAAVGQAKMAQDSVGGDAAFPGAGAAAPGSAPPPTLIPGDDDDDGRSIEAMLWLR